MRLPSYLRLSLSLRHQAACCFTQATYLSIQFCKNFSLSAPMLPASCFGLAKRRYV